MFNVGDEVTIAHDSKDNYEGYEGITLVITNKETSSEGNPGFDDTMDGQGLYDLVTKDGEEVPFALYDYELE